MADYTTAADVRAMLTDSNFTTDTSYDTLLGAFVTAASRLIDRYCGGEDSWFSPSTDDQTRYFDGSGDRELWINAALSITGVSVAESGNVDDYTDWTVDTDYFVYPYNYSDIGKPIRKLIVRWDGNKGRFLRFPKAVKIIGVFGYSATTPADVAMAAKIQTMRWFMRAKQGFEDTAASAAVGQMFYTQELDPDIKLILQHYRMVNTAI